MKPDEIEQAEADNATAANFQKIRRGKKDEHFEPWNHIQDHIIVDSRGRTVIVSDRDWAIMKHLRRIVACVNACRDIPTHVLENAKITVILKRLDEAGKGKP